MFWAGLGYRSTDSSTPSSGTQTKRWRIPIDVVRDGDTVIVEASLPGMKPAQISVTIDDNVMRIAGSTGTDDERPEGSYILSERRTGAFERSLGLPDSVDIENVHTDYEAGVLTVTLPKLEAKKAKQLTISVKGNDALTAT